MEVFPEFYSQHLGRTNGYICISGKIAINLHGEKHDGQQSLNARIHREVFRVINRINIDCCPIRNDHFQHISKECYYKALFNVLWLEIFFVFYILYLL